MKRSLLAAMVMLAALATSNIAAAPEKESAPDETAAITAIIEGFHRALHEGDRGAVLRFLAADAVLLESGDKQSRAEYEREHLAEDIAFGKATSSKLTSLDVKKDGNVAWSASTYRTSGSFEGKSVDSVSAELVVSNRTSSGWPIRAIHWSSHKINQSK